jgi:hypothetical protein
MEDKAMKTLLISFLLIFAVTAMFAVPTPDEYVKTKNDVLYYSKLKVGPTKARIILDNGEKVTLLNNEMIAYKKDGKVFEKVPLYYKDKPTGREVFMEILKYSNGMKLYRYSCFEQEVNLPFSVGSTQQVDKFFVFKNGNYHLQVDEANYQTVFGFFGIKAVKG